MRGIVFLVCSAPLLWGCAGSEFIPSENASVTLDAPPSSLRLVEYHGQHLGTIVSGDVQVPIHTMASAYYDSRRVDIPLHLSGFGTQKKSVLIAAVEVAIVVSYTAQPITDPQSPMPSVAASPGELLQITMLRDVSANQVRSAIEPVLKANGLGGSHPIGSQILGLMSTPVRRGQTNIFVCLTDVHSIEHLFIDSVIGKRHFSGPQIGYQLWTLWFGNTTSGDGETLKRQLTSYSDG